MPGSCANLAELKKLLDGYDTGIAFTDHLAGMILDKLRESGIYDDTAVIITSDHGEALGEFGIYSEHGTADESTCHVPMMIKGPGIRKGAVDQGLHYNLDLPPTMADLLGVAPGKEWDGQSYMHALTEGTDEGRNHLVISQMAHVCQRSARSGDWIYIRTYHDEYHLFPREMLYNVKQNPHEQHDLAQKYPELCAQGAKIILDWHDEQMLKSPSQIDPLWTVIHENGPYHTWDALPQYLRRLDATGRKDGADRLRAEYHCE